jgi:undecaprenyl-diphosphatase
MVASQEPIGAGLDRVHVRFIHNLRRPVEIVHGRFVRRAPHYPPTRWLLWLVVVMALAGVCLLFLDDAAARHWKLWPPALKAFAETFTQLGLGQWYLLPPLAWLLVANQIDWARLSRRRLMAAYNRTCLAFFVLIAVGLPGLAALLVKLLVGRARPYSYRENGLLSLHPFRLDSLYASFPSGHATTIGAVAGILVLLFPRWKYVALVAAVWVAATRVLLGAHYPSDTVAGLGLGFGLAVMTAQVFARLGFLFRQRSGSLPVLRRSMWSSRRARKKGRGTTVMVEDAALSGSG